MDAGLAAVLGALAGAVATTGAALAGGWAVREQAKITARGEHRRERRQERQAVYEEFILLANNLADKTNFLLLPSPRNNEDVVLLLRDTGNSEIRSAAGQSQSLYKQLLRSLPRVQLAGPKEVKSAAAAVIELSGSVSGTIGGILALLDPPMDDEWREACTHWVDLSDGIDRFTEAARLALDDDGT